MTQTQYDFTSPFEGVVPHMYRDTRGYVTVGVGFMLPAQASCDLIDWAPYTDAQATRDWLRVKAMEPGRPASVYYVRGACRMSDAAMRKEFDERVRGYTSVLRGGLPDFATYPEPAQCALIDMAYNMGPAALLRKWPNLLSAVRERDWANAVLNCLRQGVQPARNLATEKLFREAATLDPRSVG